MLTMWMSHKTDVCVYSGGDGVAGISVGGGKRVFCHVTCFPLPPRLFV